MDAVTVTTGTLLLIFIGVVIWVNVWNWKRRSGMTEAERKSDYDDMRIPGDW